MPNRIIKDTIRTSKSVNSLTDFQFRVWAYLITYVDDYGRGSADAELLQGLVFPRRKKEATPSKIKSALVALADAGLISLYESDGEPYFYFPKWANHQRIQAKKPKFPEPPCPTVNYGEKPPEYNPIQYESNTESESESNTESKENARAETPEPPAPPTSPTEVFHKHGQYGWVKLTDEQYGKLSVDLGPAELARCITYVDESAQSTGNKNKWKDWNLVVRRCSREGWGLPRTRSGKQVTTFMDV